MQRTAWIPASAALVGATIFASRTKWFNNVLHARAASAASSPPKPATSTTTRQVAIDLLPENLKELMEKKERLFVTFYAVWCPHCRNVFPVLDQVASLGSDQLNGVIVCKMNADKYKEFRTHFDVLFFPKFVYMAPGKDDTYTVAEYTGERDVPSMSTWIREISDFISQGRAVPEVTPLRDPVFGKPKPRL